MNAASDLQVWPSVLQTRLQMALSNKEYMSLAPQLSFAAWRQGKCLGHVPYGVHSFDLPTRFKSANVYIYLKHETLLRVHHHCLGRRDAVCCCIKILNPLQIPALQPCSADAKFPCQARSFPFLYDKERRSHALYAPTLISGFSRVSTPVCVSHMMTNRGKQPVQPWGMRGQ